MAGPAHVLIVDDNADLRDALGILLESEGHQVMEAADGQLALDALASGASVVVIILDLMMPVMDGATFLAHKAQGVHAEVPVVVFSSSPSLGLEGFAGVVAVIPKLDGIEGLLEALRRAGAAPNPYAAAGGLDG
jgi:CheY-like chemotaxis protein